MNDQSITIRQTGMNDLAQTVALWNDGDVLKFVGFPDGLDYDMQNMERWLSRIETARPKRNRCSIYDRTLGYCGETTLGCVSKI